MPFFGLYLANVCQQIYALQDAARTCPVGPNPVVVTLMAQPTSFILGGLPRDMHRSLAKPRHQRQGHRVLHQSRG